jgi:hypothetical protein
VLAGRRLAPSIRSGNAANLIVITTLRSCEAIPQEFEPVFADARTASILRTRPWLEAFARSGMDAGSRFRLYAIAEDGEPLALLPAVVSRLYRAHGRARVLHFIQPDGEPYSPLAPSDRPDFAPILYGLLECIAAERRRCDVIRVSPLDPASVFARLLQLNLRERHYPMQAFRHLDDRYESTDGMSSEAYLAARPSALMTDLRDRIRPFFESGQASFRLITETSELDAAHEAYLTVLESNPREAEIEPEGYARDVMHVAADAGALRFGVIEFDGTPVAVQMWIASADTARCLRIWSNPRVPSLLLDDALVERMVPHLLDVDHVRELNFGAIGDAFAQTWAPRKRERIGIIAFNPRTWRGIKSTIRHIVLPKVLSVPRRVRRKLLGRGA